MLPDILLPYQQQWIADPAPLKVAEKSRRIGLTWCEAADDVMIAAKSKAQGGSNVYYIGYNQDMSLEFIETCAEWATVFNTALSSIEQGFWETSSSPSLSGGRSADKNIQTYTIKFPDSGHRITALSSRPANLRGKQGVFVIDEAAFHDKLDELLKGVMATLIWGGKARIISTHNGDDNPFQVLINEIKTGSRPASLHRTTFADAVSQRLYKRVALKSGKDWSYEDEQDWVESIYNFYGEDAVEELDVVPRSSKGAYIPATLIEPSMQAEIPVLREAVEDAFALLPDSARRAECQFWIEKNLAPILEQVNKDRWHVFGQDFARSGHLSVITVLEIGQDLVRRCLFVLEMRNIPTRQQEQILWHILSRIPRLQSGAMDAGGNGETLAEYTRDRFGSHIEGIKLNNAFYGCNMPLFKSAFEDQILKIPRDADIRNDIRSIKVKQGIPKMSEQETKGRDGKVGHGDAAIALFLAYYASLQTVVNYDYEAVQLNSRAWH